MAANLSPVFIQQADTSEEESAIGEMVFELYGLTQEERDIVRGKE